MALINIMESIVKEKLDSMLPYIDCCKCEQCYYDIMAITLNYLKPKYVNTLKGELFVKVSSTMPQNNIDVDISIIKAIEIVKQHPHRK